MRIGDLARAAGCSTRAIRHYHSAGAFPEPPRNSSGYRDYGISDVAEVLRIRALVDAGVPVQAICDIGSGLGPTEREHLSDALRRLDDRIAGLMRQRDRLESMLTGTFGLPADIREGVRATMISGVAKEGAHADFELEAHAEEELASLELMALSGVATERTWTQIRRNLLDNASIGFTHRAARAWVALAHEPVERFGDENEAIRRLSEEVMIGHRLGVFRGVAETLVPGDVPITVGDAKLTGAQAELFAHLVATMSEGESASDAGGTI
ncbi:MerR family transcriptional regulator [Corynebacterium sp. NPDC060344]|uniref:MerR family transcriptional regulator n=1 Tax=Corynebacterium sp. NPDC060344 TaxID=3347101 RepID=UPI00365D2991